MEPFRHHVFVCTQQKPEGVTCCPASGSMSILGALHGELGKQGLSNDVQVSTCGCLGLCDDGPIMIVYPEGVWYRKLKADDVPEIVASHLKSGTVVSRLVWNDPPAMKAAATEHTQHYLAMVKARDEAGTLPDDLNDMVRAFMPSRALLTALELDIFTAIADGASAEQVAKKIWRRFARHGNAAQRARELEAAREARRNFRQHSCQRPLLRRRLARQCPRWTAAHRSPLASLVHLDRVCARRNVGPAPCSRRQLDKALHCRHGPQRQRARRSGGESDRAATESSACWTWAVDREPTPSHLRTRHPRI